MPNVLVSYLVVFVASFCTLVLEILAGRILAPYIGVSLYTWTSIIGVVLAGISLGNYAGGKVADRFPRHSTLGIILALGGLSSLSILPLIQIATSATVPGLIAKIVFLTTAIFFLPSFILGMVSPVVVKLTLKDLSRTGTDVGKIYAFSTLGSIVGTFATGFYLIQAMGTRLIVLVVGVILLVMAVVFGGLLRARRISLVCLVVLLLAVAILAPARLAMAYNCFGNGDPNCFTRSISDGIEQTLDSGCLRETSYYCIKVYPEEFGGGGRNVQVLALDHLVHSYTSLEDPTYLKYSYIKVYAELMDYVAQRKPDFSALFIGGGGYTMPKYAEVVYPQSRLEVMEIDPGVTEVAYEKLGLKPDTRIVTYNFDARLMLMQLNGRSSYDLVFGDAFNDLSVPYHLTTREFGEMVRDILTEDGIYMVNVIDKLRGGQFLRAFVTTLKRVFPHVYVLADGQLWDSSGQNTYVVAASKSPLDETRLKQVNGQGGYGRTITNIMPPEVMDRWLAEAPNIVLTDDYAPADNLVAPLFLEF